jgi:hypothetical protein
MNLNSIFKNTLFKYLDSRLFVAITKMLKALDRIILFFRNTMSKSTKKGITPIATADAPRGIDVVGFAKARAVELSAVMASLDTRSGARRVVCEDHCYYHNNSSSSVTACIIIVINSSHAEVFISLLLLLALNLVFSVTHLF